jgi:predicted nucleic acid-binding protein
VILYLDTSAVVKRYIIEVGSDAVRDWMRTAEFVATNLTTRAETVAALARAVRMKALRQKDALNLIDIFRADWPDYWRLPITEGVVSRADELAWQYNLRGSDAMHLASALLWQENLQEVISLATFDRQLWKAAGQSGLAVLPDVLESLNVSGGKIIK